MNLTRRGAPDSSLLPKLLQELLTLLCKAMSDKRREIRTSVPFGPNQAFFHQKDEVRPEPIGLVTAGVTEGLKDLDLVVVHLSPST
jgi:hypothetical protein